VPDNYANLFRDVISTRAEMFVGYGLSNMAFQLAKIDDIDVPTQFYNEHTVVSLTEDPTTSSALAFSAVMPETAGTFRVNSPGSFGSISDNVYLNYTWAFEVSQVPAPLSVTIDIKPGSDPNSVNPRSKGVIPVAVLGSGEFYAPLVDFLTVEFGPGKASPVHDGHVEDVNGDGFDDMVFHFKTQDTGIVCGDTDASLTGSTFANPDSVDIEGTDTVKTVGCDNSKQDTIISTKGAGAMSWIFLVGLSVLGLWRRNR